MSINAISISLISSIEIPEINTRERHTGIKKVVAHTLKESGRIWSLPYRLGSFSDALSSKDRHSNWASIQSKT